jgi:predicted DNA-binding protein YlxM (UPF0122 family)
MSRLEDFDTLNIEIEDLTNKNRNIIHKEEKSNVLNALDVIDPIYKEVIVLFYLKDLSYKEVADILTIPIGTVMSRLSRGKKQLKSVLKFKDLASDNTKTMKPHHPKKQILNQKKKIINEDAILDLIKDETQFKKIIEGLSDDYNLKEKLQDALQSIEVPKDLKSNILKAIRAKSKIK